MDRDGDGKISQEDWLEALTLAGADVTMYEADFQNLFLTKKCFREDVNKMYQELDKDFDGKLSWKEFIGLIKGVYKEMSFFHRLATSRQLA